MKEFLKQMTAGIFICILPGIASANAGAFNGSGQTIWLSKTANVQMISEQVTMKAHPRPSSEPLDMSLHELDLMTYECSFTLKNLSHSNVSIQVGFPLDKYNENGVPSHKGTFDEALRNYKFLAIDDKREYQTRYVNNDRDNKFKHLFVWDMTFAPQEVIHLKISYEIPVSVGIADTRRSSFSDDHTPRREYQKKWYAIFQGALTEGFSYVTETGQSWSGNIEKAIFFLNAVPLEERLMNLRADEETDFGAGLYQFIKPDGWKKENGIIKWTYENYKPSQNIHVFYFIYSSPHTVKQCERMMKKLFGESRSEDDLIDFREIIAAQYGVSPSRKPVLDFVGEQVWFDKDKAKHERDLNGDQKKVLKYIDKVIRENQNK